MQRASYGFIEKVTYALRSLYDSYGYSQYRMSKFEEYDLYARNKDFLISDGVITFTDTNGKLMALKPDVTLSIVKNTKDEPDTVQKVYYNENVYRVSKGSRAFREIMQLGLECIGDIDDYSIFEVLSLAAESLKAISPRSILSISHLGLMSGLIDRMGVPVARKAAVLKCIGEKNRHELSRICTENGVAEADIDVLNRLVEISCGVREALPSVKALLAEQADPAAMAQFETVMNALADSRLADMLHIDFSVVDDVHYYNGFVFKGFVESVPSSVLSGGQYDKLMQKMGKKSGAVGFAVYMDALDRLDTSAREYDVDVVLLYEPGASIARLQKTVRALMESGSSVAVQKRVPEGMKYRLLMKLKDGEVEVVENDA